MPWSTISTSEVMQQSLSPQEQSALQTIQGSSSTIAAILSAVVNMARGYIVAGGNQLDAEGTIPDQFRQEVLDITRWRYLTGFPALKALQTDARKNAHDEALKRLMEIARTDATIRVELPAAATAINQSAPVNSIKVVSGNRRQLSRWGTRGL